MLYEVTLNPSLFDPPGEPDLLRYLIEALWSVSQYCVVPNLADGQLTREVETRCRNTIEVHPNEAKRLMALLGILKKEHRFVFFPRTGGRSPGKNVEWLEEAIGSCGKSAFAHLSRARVIQKLSGVSSSSCLSIEDLWKSDSWHGRTWMKVVGRDVEGIVKGLRPLVRYSPELRLIDYVLAERTAELSEDRGYEKDPKGKHHWLSVIEGLLKAWLDDCVVKKGTFRIETRLAKRDGDKRKRLVETGFRPWKSVLSRVVQERKESASVTVHVRWEDPPRSKMTRERFLLSPFAGVLVPKGFDATTADEKMHLSLLDRSKATAVELGVRKLEEALRIDLV